MSVTNLRESLQRQLSLDEQKKYSVIIGVDYPHPIVDLEKSVITNEQIYNAAL